MTKLILVQRKSLHPVGNIYYVHDLLIEIILAMSDYLQKNKLPSKNILSTTPTPIAV